VQKESHPEKVNESSDMTHSDNDIPNKDVRRLTILGRLWDSLYFPWILFAFGAAVRLRIFFAVRSLWLDEASLAVDVLHNDMSTLLGSGVNAPDGFLAVTKLATIVGGGHELVLRLIPLLAGIATLPLIYHVGKRMIGRHTARLATVFLAISPTLIYYSAEFKQYSADAVIGLTLYAVIFLGARKRERLALPFTITAAGLGGLAIWFSHPACFVLPAIGVVLFTRAAASRDSQRTATLAGVGAVWAISFAALYLISLQELGAQDSLIQFWQTTYMPLPPRSLTDLLWFPRAVLGLFAYPGDIYPAGVGVFAFVAGAAATYREKRDCLWALLLPIGLALLASGLHRYPFSGRFLVFSVPALFLLVGRGATWLWSRSVGRPAAILLVFLLLAMPLARTTQKIISPPEREAFRPLLKMVAEQRQASDTIYVYYGAKRAFQYYRSRFFSGEETILIGSQHRDDQSRYARELNRLDGRGRVWILMSHVYDDERKFFLKHLEALGSRRGRIHAKEVWAYLYDFSTDKNEKD
jgi:hypothetical protein